MNQIEVPMPEKPEKVNWDKFMNRLLGFDEWVEKNKQQFLKKYGKNNNDR